jgi:hypothetical protein
MTWDRECGFQNFQPKIDLLVKLHSGSVKKIKQQYPKKNIDLTIIDGCWPDRYKNQTNTLLITSNVLVDTDLDPHLYEQFQNSWYGLYAGNVPVEVVEPEKNFNCFMNRLCPTRQSWLYQLVRNDLLDQGFVSFNLDISRNVFAQQHDNDARRVFEWQYQNWYKNFEPEHDFIKSQVPYRNFENHADLQSLIMKSKFSIVLETYFERNEIITLSEKIFRQLKLPRPWVLFAMKHAVKYLRDNGFDVLDDIVDHSYDEIDFDIARQVKILQQLPNLCNLNYNQQLVDRLEQAAKHNQLRLNQLLERFDQDLTKSFDQAVEKIINV